MPQIVKMNMEGKETEDITLDETIFNHDINEPLVHKVVTAQMATKRRGTASTKGRSEVRGGGRKPWRQKGTGRARHGSIRSPLWVGGGITFGPKPRSYDKKVSKREKNQALKSILSDKLKTESLIVLDELSFSEIKTKNALELMKNLKIEGKKVIIILPEKDKNIYLSCRNLPEVKTLVIQALNAYDLLDNDYILLSEETVSLIEEVLGK